MNPLQPPANSEEPLSRFEDCTVTSVSPLRILRDGDTDPLDYEPRTLVAPTSLTIGDRVHVENTDGTITVIGVAGGTYDSGWVTLTVASGFTATQPVQIRRIGLIVYMRGVITPTTNWGTAGSSNTVVAAAGIPSDMRNSVFVTTQPAAPFSTTMVLFRCIPQADGSILIACGTATSAVPVILGGISWPIG